MADPSGILAIALAFFIVAVSLRSDAFGLQPVERSLASACWRNFLCFPHGWAGPFWGPTEISLAKTIAEAHTEMIAE